MKHKAGSKKRTPEEIKAILLAEKEKEEQLKKQKAIAEQKSKLLDYFNRDNEFCLHLLTHYYPATDSFIKKNFNNPVPFSVNSYMQWTEVMLIRYKEQWDWALLSKNPSLPWSEKLIEKYEEEWDWDLLSTNTGFPWTAEFIEKYQDKWDWEALSDNPSLPWSIDLINRYQEEWNWDNLSWNKGLPWSEELIEKYLKRWNWMEFGLSANENLPWNKNFIEKYLDKWHWTDLCANAGIPWTQEWLNAYQDYWKEEGESFLWLVSPHPTIFQWSKDLIKAHRHEWHWGDDARPGLSSNLGLPWSEDLIRLFEENWDWSDGLSDNPNLPWSFDLYLKYEKKWDKDVILNNYAFWQKAISPYFDEELINDFFYYLSANAK
jgi:hypothetical protein